MYEWLYVIFSSMLPFGELRLGIPTGISLGLNPILVYFVAVFFNILIIFPIWVILDNLHEKFLDWKFYNNFFNKYITKSRRKLEKYLGTEKEMFGVFLLTAIPLPMTGAYTASILAWFFNLNKTKSAKAIGYGVAVAGLIVMGITLGLWGLLF